MTAWLVRWRFVCLLMAGLLPSCAVASTSAHIVFFVTASRRSLVTVVCVTTPLKKRESRMTDNYHPSCPARSSFLSPRTSVCVCVCLLVYHLLLDCWRMVVCRVTVQLSPPALDDFPFCCLFCFLFVFFFRSPLNQFTLPRTVIVTINVPSLFSMRSGRQSVRTASLLVCCNSTTQAMRIAWSRCSRARMLRWCE